MGKKVAWTPLVPRASDDVALASFYLETIWELEKAIEIYVISQIKQRAPLVEDAHPLASVLATIASLKQVYNSVAAVTLSRLRRILDSIRFRVKYSPAQEVVGSIGGFSIAPMLRSMQDVIDVRIQANVSLIKSVPQQMLTQIEQVVANGINGGMNIMTMIEQIREVYPVTEKRARLIARDQVGKIYSDIERKRQEEAGITEYVWETAGDSRVRPTHRENQGKVFRWDSPPATGHPGTEINCRCIAIPVIDL